MPALRALCGRPVALRTPPPRFLALVVLLLVAAAHLSYYGPPQSARLPARLPASLPTYDQVADAVKHPAAHVPTLDALPEIPRPFGPAVHQPPVQPNSTATSSYRAIEWLADFKWRNPFSSAVAVDENRAVLPPLRTRPPVYTYYDAPGKQPRAVAEAEQRLLLAWRRAWWAQGFKPQVLNRREAHKHALYLLVQRMKLDAKTETDMMRWLAWAHMGGGVLVNWLALPMAEYDNPMLAFLRRAEYPKLSRVHTLGNGVFFGEAAAIHGALTKVVNHDLLKNVTANIDKITQLSRKEGGAVVNLLPAADIAVDQKADGIAYYTAETMSTKYGTVNDKLTNTTQAEGLQLLASLINSHLHLTFQERHPEGVAIVKPLPDHTTALMFEATQIARNLTQCPSSPMPKSCPPNRPKCVPCDVNKSMKLQEFPEFVNTTKFFTIGTVPHPYTMTSLHYTRDTLDAGFLRTMAVRNQWIQELTKKSVGKDKTESYRLVQFKELVAAAPPHTLWLTAERVTQHDLDWIFGFDLPQIASTTKEPSSPNDDSQLIIFPRPDPPTPIQGKEAPDEIWIKKEEIRLGKARDVLKSKDERVQKIVDEVEQWNLADTEAWKFARAYSARRRMERKKWEQDEQDFAGSEKKAGVR
ncbi:hypothetical protein BDU57DRAFT_248866 [Ampelomyces quisqualis]|uniref:Uncharacterized protein n=1 Tax=Ampelomyces quisqualis TaxID=50730 RepID=A0A6A5QNF1_AMPQU|nr:hypothetical protein BDU57DRAFT_248866 [Ampelomyces quisqualis]